MNHKRSLRILLPIFVLLISALACSLPGGAGPAATQTMEALATIVEANLPSGEATKAPDAASPADATQPPAEATEETLPTPTVAHQIQPSNPGSIKSFMTDRSSAALASERKKLYDRSFERSSRLRAKSQCRYFCYQPSRATLHHPGNGLPGVSGHHPCGTQHGTTLGVRYDLP